jgi:hypothetical protein
MHSVARGSGRRLPLACALAIFLAVCGSYALGYMTLSEICNSARTRAFECGYLYGGRAADRVIDAKIALAKLPADHPCVEEAKIAAEHGFNPEDGK